MREMQGAMVVSWAFVGFLTIAFDSMKETIAAFDAAGIRPGCKVMIGGGQIDETVRAIQCYDIDGNIIRVLTDEEKADEPRVCIIDTKFAETHFAGRDPLGQRMMFGAAGGFTMPLTVVGVASASAVPGTERHRAAWHMYEISRADEGWKIEGVIRGMKADDSGVVELGRFAV